MVIILLIEARMELNRDQKIFLLQVNLKMFIYLA